MARGTTFLFIISAAIIIVGGCATGTIGEYSQTTGTSSAGGSGFTCDDETCDGFDNDCDGFVDEQCPCDEGDEQSCYSGSPFTADVGLCKSGTQACDEGEWGTCQGQQTPGGEECDALDNDCDGLVDEDCPCDEGSTQDCYTGNPVTVGIGICERGTQSCEGGSWGSCEGSVSPTSEVCNGEDDDCNGIIDTDAEPLPATGGRECANAIDLGEVRDAQSEQVSVDGNGVTARGETWWMFEASDDADTNGDEFHVDVRFMVNPNDAYVMDVYRGSCDAGDLLFQNEASTCDWYTDQDRTSTGCGGPSPCGEGNCSSSPGPNQNQCDDDSATFYVRIRPATAQGVCDSYTLEVSNGVH